MADPICEAWWLDDYGRDHGCQEDHGHIGGHECGCGARIPAHLLDVAVRLARAVDWATDEIRPLTGTVLPNERAALRTLAADARRAGLLAGGGQDD